MQTEAQGCWKLDRLDSHFAKHKQLISFSCSRNRKRLVNPLLGVALGLFYVGITLLMLKSN